MEVVSISEVVSTIDEPLGNAESNGIGNNLLDLLPCLLSDFSGSGIKVDLGDFANQMGESGANSSDCGKREGDFALSFEVGVQDSDDMLEFNGAFVYKTLALVILPSVFSRVYKTRINFKRG